ncbi:MAG: hypothetical protein MUE96_03015 [Bacteroidia bacterium]|jgi:hypothetical protein|nr:hypothetical protein [Bacteroidia bacterium]
MGNQIARTYIFIFLSTITSLLQAQQIDWSNQQKVKNKTSYTKVIGENSTGIFVARCKNGDFLADITLEKYKSNLALDNSIDLKQPYGSVLESLLLLPDGVLVVASARNDSVPKIDVFCWKVDASLKSGPINMLTRIDASLFKSNTEMNVHLSANKQFLTIAYITAGSTKETGTIWMKGFDANLQPRFEKMVNVQYAPADIVLSNMEADNKGNAHLLIDYPRVNSRKRNEKELRDFFIYSYFAATDRVLEFSIGTDSFFINDIGFTVNNQAGILNVAGTYSLEQNNAVMGTFMYAIDMESALVKTAYFEPMAKSFSSKVSSTMLNETGPYLTDLYIRKVIPRSDGGCILITEKYSEVRQTYTYYAANGFPQTASRTEFKYDEIVVISKNAEGKTQFQEFIKKNQSSINDGGYYSSFVLLNTPEKLHFIYSNDVSNEGDIMVSSMNPLGQVETKILIKAISYYVLLMPKESKQIGYNASLICTLKDRRFTLLKLTY